MKKFKFGFSTTELIVVLVIISFIIIQEMLITTKKMNEYGAYYYNAYNTLRKVTYNIFIDTYCPDSNNLPDPAEGEEGYDKDYDCTKGPRLFPKDGAELCKRYAEYYNIPGDIAVCKKEKPEDTALLNINDLASNISDATLRFKTSNGYRFYFSDNNGAPYIYEAHEKGAGLVNVEYFIVYIDINGAKKPNRVNMDESFVDVYPDIVPFAVTRRGEVIPMGLPAYSMSYMTARVRYPDKLNSDNISEDLSESMSFRNAVRIAWRNGTDDVDIPFSYRMTEKLKSNNLARFFLDSTGKVINKKVVGSEDVDLTNDHGKDKCEAQTTNCLVEIDSSGYVRN